MPSLQIALRHLPKDRAFAISNHLDEQLMEHGITSGVFEDAHDDDWRIDIYMEGDDAAHGEALLRGALPTDAADLTPEIVVLADTDWVMQSLEGLDAVRAGRFVVHGLHTRDAVKSGDISLWVEAGRAFGTGHHGTTLGCLEAIDYVLSRRRIHNAVDIGTGTGVLAMAVAKKAKVPVIASDIDPLAVTIARDNARQNQCGTGVQFVTAAGTEHPALQSGAPYDMVIANILARPLIHLSRDLTRLMEVRGHMVLSGLLVEQQHAVLSAYRRQGLIPEHIIHHGEWATLLLKPMGSR